MRLSSRSLAIQDVNILKSKFQVAKRGGFLGFMFGIGLLISLSSTTLTHFGWYLVALCFFHWSEYFTTAVTNPGSLSLESYLLDHSREYKLAAICSWTEFFVEWFLFPGNGFYKRTDAHVRWLYFGACFKVCFISLFKRKNSRYS